HHCWPPSLTLEGTASGTNQSSLVDASKIFTAPSFKPVSRYNAPPIPNMPVGEQAQSPPAVVPEVKSKVNQAPRFPAMLRYLLSKETAKPTATWLGVEGSVDESLGLLQITFGIAAPPTSAKITTWVAEITAISAR